MGTSLLHSETQSDLQLKEKEISQIKTESLLDKFTGLVAEL